MTSNFAYYILAGNIINLKLPKKLLEIAKYGRKLPNTLEKLLTDYYFEYGGNVSLQAFLDKLQKSNSDVAKKYAELFKKYGLDPDEFKQENDSL